MRAFLRLVDDRALGLRAAVRLRRRADRDVRGDRPGATGSTSLLVTRGHGRRRARSRWPPTGSSTGRSTRATRAPPGASWSPARCSVRTAMDRRGRRAGRLPGRRGARSTRSASRWRRSRWSRWCVYPYAKRFTDLPHAVLGAGPGGRAGRRLDRGDRHVVGSGAGLVLGARGGHSGSAASTSSTPARTPRSTGVIGVAVGAGPVRRARPRCAPPRSRTWSRSRCFVWFGVLAGLGLAVVRRAGADRGRVRVRARDRARRRPVPGQPGVLHRERLRRHRACSCFAGGRPGRRPAACARDRAAGAMRTPWVVGVSGASGTPYAAGGAARAAGRRACRWTWWCRGRPG